LTDYQTADEGLIMMHVTVKLWFGYDLFANYGTYYFIIFEVLQIMDVIYTVTPGQHKSVREKRSPDVVLHCFELESCVFI
jgi:hypothetical protein